MNFEVIAQSLPLYLQGGAVTLWLLALSLVLGLALALPLALARSAASAWAWRPVWLFTYVLRGTPLRVSSCSSQEGSLPAKGAVSA